MARTTPVVVDLDVYADQPVSRIAWMHRDALKANDYNPNKVAPPELALLRISILEDGWTQPIVILDDGTIVDGYHRWLVSGDPDVLALTDGYVPVVTLRPPDEASKRMATVRHNRARGSHHVVRMADLVTALVDEGMDAEQIGRRLMMEPDEVERLARHGGILLKAGQADEWSKPWAPTRDARPEDVVDLTPAREDDETAEPGGDDAAEEPAR